LLDTNLKIILFDHQNKFVILKFVILSLLSTVCNLKNNEQCYKKFFDILATDLSILHNYFYNSTKITFLICIQLKFFSFNRSATVTSPYLIVEYFLSANDFSSLHKYFNMYILQNNETEQMKIILGKKSLH